MDADGSLGIELEFLEALADGGDAQSTLSRFGWEPHPADGFIALVGPFWQRKHHGWQMGFFADDRHRNRRGVVQGGMLATLADRAMGGASRLVNADLPQATIQLSYNYVGAAEIGQFIHASCKLRRKTRHLSFVESDLFADGMLIGTATGIWKILS